MSDEYCNSRTRSRKLWDKHGSWLVLVFVIALAFNAGQEVEGYKRNAIIKTIVESGVKKRDDLRLRLRKANDENRKLTSQLPQVMNKAEEAVKKADEITQKIEASQ